MTTARRNRADVYVELEVLLARLVSDGVLQPLSAQRVAEIWRRFVAFIDGGFSVVALGAATTEVVRAFVVAPYTRDDGLCEPSVATMHVRRSAIRLLYRARREYGLGDHDPTGDVVLPARSTVPGRPLSDAEVALCRSASLATTRETRLPAAWALAEATARTSELAHIEAGDLDLDAGRVWIHGASKTQARWGELSAWGVTQLDRRLRALAAGRRSGDERVVYAGLGVLGGSFSASCATLSTVLARAGLGAEPDVRPVSITAWAGHRVLTETGRIDQVARALGMRSLDRAARVIGWDWHTDDGDG